MNDNIILCCETCLYNHSEMKCIIYGQYNIHIKKTLYKIPKDKENLKEDNIKKFDLICSKNRKDFYIILNESLTLLKDKKCIFFFNDIILEFQLKFPFENSIDLNINNSAIISTMIQNYSNRIDEWITYNLKLGFSGIVLFDNGSNKNDLLETINIVNKYRDKVILINFPYKPFRNKHWNNIQRLSLSIGVNAFKKKCKFIAMIDADEFVYIPHNVRKLKIEDFLKKYNKTISIPSNILTNRYKNEIFDNNILSKAIYIGEDKYAKIIIHTYDIKNEKFIITPHEHKKQKILKKETLIHYHVWLNERYKYRHNMKKTYRLINYNEMN